MSMGNSLSSESVAFDKLMQHINWIQQITSLVILCRKNLYNPLSQAINCVKLLLLLMPLGLRWKRGIVVD